ncbi:hypothetical protein [Marinibacterium profundimaris]|nr:hypothetical protein [Marinibacterium profundimaris]
MKAIFTGIVVMALIAVGAYYGLHELGYSSQARFSGDNVRLD